MSFYISLNH